MHRENVGPEVRSSDEAVSSEFDCGPPLGIHQGATSQQVRDALLGDAGVGPSVAEVLPHAGGKSFLGAAISDRATERSNVRFLHDPQRFTRNLVDVNNNACSPGHKDACKVLVMPQVKRKTQQTAPAKGAKKARVKQLDVGPDGLTLPQRLHRLMAERGIGQTALAKMCSEYYSAFVPGVEDKVKQQHIFNLLSGQANAWCLPLVAAVLDVNDLWLQFGIGKRERNS